MRPKMLPSKHRTKLRILFFVSAIKIAMSLERSQLLFGTTLGMYTKSRDHVCKEARLTLKDKLFCNI